MQTITLQGKNQQRYLNGYPLITQDVLPQSFTPTTDWVRFETNQHQFIGVGYIGEEQRGMGWILTSDDKPFSKKTIVQLMKKARQKRQAFFKQMDVTNAFRLINGIGDQLGGITVDFYNGYAVLSWYNRTIEMHKNEIVQALQTVFPEIKGIYQKWRYQNATKESAHLLGEKASEPLVILENGVQYATYMNEGLMTGIFLDQKHVRGRLIDGQACGQNVLNLFSYTGAFSVAAAMGGATHTTSVDLAKRSRPKTNEMFAINGIDDQNIYVMDVFDYAKWAQKKGLTYDMIILDPPGFARNGKKTFSVAKDYTRLVRTFLPLLSPGGTIIASTNVANISKVQFQKMVEQAFKDKNRTYRLQHLDQLPEDFATHAHYKESQYLKVFTYQLEA